MVLVITQKYNWINDKARGHFQTWCKYEQVKKVNKIIKIYSLLQAVIFTDSRTAPWTKTRGEFS